MSLATVIRVEKISNASFIEDKNGSLSDRREDCFLSSHIIDDRRSSSSSVEIKIGNDNKKNKTNNIVFRNFTFP